MGNNKIIEDNTGKWDKWYEKLPDSPSSFMYGDTVTYKKAADFLSDCVDVEDWGCGGGGFLLFRPDAIGVDGSDTKFASKKFINLREYTSDCEAIHIRHVLEHNYAWYEILKNAMLSAERKIVITFFIPLNDTTTHEINHNKRIGVDVPDMSISRSDFMEIVNRYKPYSVVTEKFKTKTVYGEEEIVYITLDDQ